MLASSLVASDRKKEITHRHHIHENFAQEMTCEACADESGIKMEVALTTDFLRNVTGGVEVENTILGNIDLIFELDTAKLGWWDNGTFYTYFLGNFNTNGGMTQYAGDYQASSNIEATEAVRLYEFWYEHSFGDNLSLLVGLHDYNSEFNALEYGSLFINSSFGIEPDISQVGPSIFSIAALAARVAYKPSETSYVLAAVYDGIAGDPLHEKRTTILFNHGDGIFASVEAGIADSHSHESDYYKLALGVWYHNSTVHNYAEEEVTSNSGVYLIGEKTLYSNGTKVIGGFFQLGSADSNKNVIGPYVGAGLNFKGAFSGRSDDLLGLAVAHARITQGYKHFMLYTDGINIEDAETAIELTYEAQLMPWLVVQPNAQYIINPSADPTLDNAFVVGARVTLLY